MLGVSPQRVTIIQPLDHGQLVEMMIVTVMGLADVDHPKKVPVLYFLLQRSKLNRECSFE